MPGSTERVMKAFAHEAPDRTPLFEIFQPYHPIHWPVCGRTVATDMAMAWDAMAEGIAYEELLAAEIDAQYRIRKHFGLDMVRLNGGPTPDYERPVKTGPAAWTRGGVDYVLNERTKLIEPANPSEAMSDSQNRSEDDARAELEAWDGSEDPVPEYQNAVLEGVKARAGADGLDWVYMGEIGAGTGAAFYPPWLLMWMAAEPDLYRRWLERQAARSFPRTRALIRAGCAVVAMGGDVSCDKGPFVSPAMYEEFILPVIRQHVDLIHAEGAKAVYTSDGNHWPIARPMFFDSGVDGYKEVDRAAGMTWPRLIEEGVSEKVCIIGNLDARHGLCNGTPEAMADQTRACLDYGRQTPGGHILHASHSVHEDVKAENYIACVDAYRDYFGLPPLEG